jgi:phosphate acetyltransferase
MSMALLDIIEEKARKICPRIVFPESYDETILQLVIDVNKRKTAVPILLGDPAEICKCAVKCSLDLGSIPIVDINNEQRKEDYVERFCADNDDYTPKMMIRKLRDPLSFANCMVRLGDADSSIAGFSYTTGEVILSGQTIIGLAEDTSTVSSFNLVSIPGFKGSEGETVIFCDVGVCVDPSSWQLADIAASAAGAAEKLLGWEPRIAFLSYSTKGSGQSDEIETVREAIAIFNKRYPRWKADGEFQLDAALSATAASKKFKGNSDVAGKANIIVFPDLNSGNTNIKSVKLFANAYSLGPILMGFRHQISDLSRTASLDHLLGTVAVVAALVEKRKNGG